MNLPVELVEGRDHSAEALEKLHGRERVKMGLEGRYGRGKMLGFLGKGRTLAKTGMLEEWDSDWGKKKTFREFVGRVNGYVVEIKLENSTGTHLYDV